MQQNRLNAELLVDTNFRATVDRELVHRHAVSEVFPTAVRQASESEFTVYAQWPRWHVFYGGHSGRFDSALVVETMRQLTVLIAHSYLAVPLGLPFLMPHMAIEMMGERLRDASRPANVTVEVQVSGRRGTRDGISGFGTAATFLLEGREIARGRATARIVDPAVYDRFRNTRAAAAPARRVEPVRASDVGHTSNWNVVIGHSSTHGRWPLRVDTTNPILFDHPLDHVPGVLLIEAVRQALRLELAEPYLDFGRFESQFFALAELDAENDVVLESLAQAHDEHLAVVSIRAGNNVLMRTLAHILPSYSYPDAALPGTLAPGQRAVRHRGRSRHG